jgi:23S rRNA (cytosine1962-C5)-methyltransferase
MQMHAQTVVVSKKGADRLKRGQPWVYAVDVERKSPDVKSGDAVHVIDGQGRFLAQAFFSQQSKIQLRWVSFTDEAFDENVLRTRLQQAIALRRLAYPDESAVRLVHAEADLLPGLVVDQFGPVLSVQLLVPAMEQRKELLVKLLNELLSPKAIINRSDGHVRTLEGLPQEKGLLAGTVPDRHTYTEGHVVLGVDVLGGQKTGAFLDQRDNHVLAGRYAQGEALDCFSYAGGFALQLALKAKKVTAVEISEAACGLITANANQNRLTNIDVVCANAFDFLRDTLDEGRRFDTIVLDPPSFAKSKQAVDAATRGYKEINLRAMQLLRPGGILISCSCTHHVDEEAFEAMLDAAAADSKRRVQILEKRGAGLDHPVLLGLRETRYLKCFVLRVA